MKNAITSLIMAVTISLSPGCSKAQRADTGKKVLIVYLSRTNNTRAIADIIHKSVGGVLVAIEPEQPYSADYRATVEQVARENESGYLPPLKTRIDSMEQYDVVFVGFPTWGMQLPPPIKSFLSQYDLRDKTVIPFNTHGGYGAGSSIETVKQLCPGSKIPEAFSMKGGSERDGQLLVIRGEQAKAAERDVKEWLRRIGMLQ